MNYYVNIDLDTIPMSYITKMKDKEGKERQVAVIVLDGNPVVYNGNKHHTVNAIAWERSRNEYNISHSLKVTPVKDVQMTEEERKALPYIGNMKEKSAEKPQTKTEPLQPGNDLPF